MILVMDGLIDKTSDINKVDQPQPMFIESQNLVGDYVRLIDIARKEFGFMGYEGAELWTQINTRTREHYDKDERLAQSTGELSFPLCSIVYYAVVKDLVGGELLVDGVAIAPKSGRVVMFSSGLLHSVNPFTGRRTSVLLNPWAKKPSAY
jgi:hypothetical protein